MTRLSNWFTKWWPILVPVLSAAALYWMGQYFVTEKTHTSDVATLRREARARWDAHTLWAEEVLKRYDVRLGLAERSAVENAGDHKEIRNLLIAIREDIAALKARQSSDSRSRDLGPGGGTITPNLEVTVDGKQTSGVAKW